MTRQATTTTTRMRQAKTGWMRRKYIVMRSA